MFDATVEDNAFPLPEPSYDAQRPLRVYGLDGKFYRLRAETPHSFQEYDTDLFWLADNTVPCIGFPHPRSSQVIIWAHANHEDVWRGREHLSWMRAQFGCHVVGFEYPGYSPAPGKATEQSTVASLEVLYLYLRYEKGFAAEDIILFARSIGTGICIKFAATNKVGGLILLSPFTSIKGVVRHGRGCGSLGALGAAVMNDMFPSIELIGEVQAPILVIHGTADELVPASMGQELIEAATYHIKQLALIPGMNHQDFFTTEYVGNVQEIMTDFLLQNRIIRGVGPSGRLGAPAEARIPNRQLCEKGRRPAVIRTFPKHTKPVDDKRLSTALISHTRSVAPLKFSKDTNLYGVFELPGGSARPSAPTGSMFRWCCDRGNTSQSSHGQGDSAFDPLGHHASVFGIELDPDVH